MIGLCGVIGSGKDTVANYLVEHHGYVKIAFGDILKDITSLLFGWNRDLVEGQTSVSRAFRDMPDMWWEQHLNCKVTPRLMLQTLGTDVFRKNFHSDIWVLAVQRKIMNLQASGITKIVVSDCRFFNELEMIQKLGGTRWNIVKHDYSNEYKMLVTKAIQGDQNAIEWCEQISLHSSEWYAIVASTDQQIMNDASKDELYQQIEMRLKEMA
jgi:dephospho-CoA kinase